MKSDETISAIATPMGTAGLAVVRVSGRDALAVAGRMFCLGARSTTLVEVDRLESHHVYFGRAFDGDELVDEVMLTVFRAPKSYTCEDTVEISCHGGSAVADRILTATIKSGSRLAYPGEFTRRAFLNGRMDLTQAEAVMELIHASSDLSRRAALHQLQGSLKRLVDRLRGDLIRCLAEIEASIDFPDEDTGSINMTGLQEALDSIQQSLHQLRNAYSEARVLREGFRTVLVGAPNTGKSSLLNALLGKERAIVSPTPGTTRDTVEELITIRGLNFRLVDTAGLRTASHAIELEGIRRTKSAMDAADVTVLVIECGRDLCSDEVEVLGRLHLGRSVVARNKVDLESNHDSVSLDHPAVVSVSAKTGEGLELLKQEFVRAATGGTEPAFGLEFMVNARQSEAASKAMSYLDRALDGLAKGHGVELVASDLHHAADALGEIIGATTREDIVDAIFSEFCIGK